MVSQNIIPKNDFLRNKLVKKASKSLSGVLVITVLTSPYPNGQKFSCKWDCYYCPQEIGQPRSYLHDEPSVLRANRNHFDPILQFYDRAVTLAMNGHPVDKVELLVLGGTWASYPLDYREEFIRDIFYAANTFCVEDILANKSKSRRKALTLREEQVINETTNTKIIGITLETRPDCIDYDEIRRFREYGCTRVQLGIQTTDEQVLKKINRKCTTDDAKRAIKLLKDSCFKIDIHIMPNLPGTTVEKDYEMFDEFLNDPDLQADQWKIYPCEIVPWTIIKKWHEKGLYKPYGEKDLFDLLCSVKQKVHPWIRLNRVVRDIPSQYILAGVNNPSMRQDLHTEFKNRGLRCMCIRCREVGLAKTKVSGELPKLVVRTYEASGGLEYFISFEDSNDALYGFCRLRIIKETEVSVSVFEKLSTDVGLVRELHVYGQLTPTKDKKSPFSQHIGLGTQMMRKAEEISRRHRCKQVVVIAGVGSRGFYRKIGYKLENDPEWGQMMVKNIKISQKNFLMCFAIVFLSFLVALFVTGSPFASFVGIPSESHSE